MGKEEEESDAGTIPTMGIVGGEWFRRLVQDDPELLDDGGGIPNSQGGGVGVSIPGYEICSMLDKLLV